MKRDKENVPRMAISSSSGLSHRHILLLALLGWIIVPVATIAFAFVQNRSREASGLLSTEERKPLIDFRHQAGNPRTQSCATSNCHGSIVEDPSPDKIRSDEYAVWLNDPHAQAFQTLSNDRSKKIFQNLGVLDERGKALESRKAEFDKHWMNCLGCHETNEHLKVPSVRSADSTRLAEGVSCESCHGDSAKWLHAHYRTDWRESVSDQSKSELGFIGNQDIAARIQRCGTCHVGSDRGEVNHDLIAAGHPALRFEYVWYESRLPKHWKPNRPSATKYRVDATHAWLIGQLVTSMASLEQLERRIEGKGLLQTGQELAEFNCFACHHDLQGTSWRRERLMSGLASGGGKISHGAIPWGNWNLSLLPILADQFDSEESRNTSAAFHRLGDAFHGGVTPSRGELNVQIVAARKSLEDWLLALKRSASPTSESFIRQLIQSHPDRVLYNWDQAATILLGYAAAYRSVHDVPDPLKRAMESIRFPIAPQIIDSPEHFLSSERPPSLTVAQWTELLQSLAELPPAAR